MTHDTTPAKVTPAQLHSALRGPDEIAVLDVREARHYAQAQIALSSHQSLSFLDSVARRVLPRTGVPIVLVDDEGGPRALAAAETLRELGYTDVRILQGGVQAWQAAGYATGTGYNTVVKAFADLAHAHYATPTITPAALQERLGASRPTTVVDCRPEPEYRRLSIAGAYNAPGVELALHDFDAHPDADHLWVISCFSRTRGIVGTTTLARLAGRGKVAFLEDGIMAAVLQGVPTGPGSRGAVPAPLIDSDAAARLAREIAKRHRLSVIDLPQYAALKAQRDERSLYVFDVRHESRYAEGHLPDAISAPGGQLVMTHDLQVPVRRARVVLVDDGDLLRATITAFWLSQFGDAEVHVLSAPPSSFTSTTAVLDVPPGVAWIDAQELAASLARGEVRLFDVGASLQYEQGHIPGAEFILRSDWAAWFHAARPEGPLVFTSPDGANAAFAARDAGRLTDAPVLALQGGTAAWRAAGLPIDTGGVPERQRSEFEDDWGSPMRVSTDLDAPFREYLAWERALGHAIASDDTVAFRWSDAVA
ncbi:MAG: rhodanese-like domain-containing protein [Rhizobacter sp.]